LEISSPTFFSFLEHFLGELDNKSFSLYNGNKKRRFMREIKALHYFALDGNYGDASGLTIIDTTDWTEQDFSHLEEVGDQDRPLAARAITEWIEKGRGNSDQDPKSYELFDKLGIAYEWKD